MQKYLILVLCILFTRCSNKQDTDSRYTEEQISSLRLDSAEVLKVVTDLIIEIDLNPFLQKQSFNFGSLVKEIKLIPLETTDESLLGNMCKIIISESHIYIMDGFLGRGIVVFDINGKFVKRMSHGQGPGELARLYDIDFDHMNNELIAYKHSFLMFFSQNGEYIRQVRLPFGFHTFRVVPDGYVFKTLGRRGNEHLGLLADYTLLVTDKYFKIKQVAMPHLPLDNVITEYDYLRNNNQRIAINQPYTDTIYQFTNGTECLKAEFVFDYSKKKLPEQYLNSNSFNEFDEVIRNNDYYFYNGKCFFTKSHSVFFLENYSIGSTVIYRDNQSGNLIGGTDANFNINEIPASAFPISSTGNYFISVFLPDKNTGLLANSSVVSNEDKLKIKKLNEDDNPVLVLYKLIDF